MSLTIKEHRTFLPTPEGSYIARCYALIDLGMQYSKFYDVTLPKIMIGWELSDKLTEEGKSLVHFQRYTASLNTRSALRGLLEGWRGKNFTPEELAGFELKNILGAFCYLTIKQVLNLLTQQHWPKVIAICALPQLITCLPCVNKLIYFDLDNYSESDYLAVPEGIRKHINFPELVKELVNNAQKPTAHTRNLFYHLPDPDEPQPDVDL